MSFALATTTHPERTTVLRMVAALAEVFGEELTDGRIEGYVAALADVPVDHLRVGMQHAMRACTWFPKPAELRRAVDTALEAERQSSRFRGQVVEDEDPRVSMACLDCEDLGLVYSKDRRGFVGCVPISKVTGSGWYVRPCPCLETNQVIKHRFARQQRRYGKDGDR